MENKIGQVISWILFFRAGPLLCVIVCIPVRLLSSEGTTLQMDAFPCLPGAFIGMIAGIRAGTLVEFVLKMLTTPAYGKLLVKRSRPFSLPSMTQKIWSVLPSGLEIRKKHGK